MSHPAWLVDEPTHDVDLGVVTTGKEAQIELRERTGDDGRSCLIARKRYLPREVTTKGELEALGFQGASTFRNDSAYRGGRDMRLGRRERAAMAQRSRFGRELLRGQWTDHEFHVLRDCHDAGVTVPYPVTHADDWIEMEYVGDLSGAAPQLHRARLAGDELVGAFEQMADGLREMVAAGWVHADLSAYNLLWWDQRVWFIDLPQAVRISTNLDAYDLLHRDVVNVCTWFARRGHTVDPEELFASLL